MEKIKHLLETLGASLDTLNEQYADPKTCDDEARLVSRQRQLTMNLVRVLEARLLTISAPPPPANPPT